MRVIDDAKALRDWRKYGRNEGGTWAFVPTMGNLHDGHLQLVKRAQEVADQVIVSVYVNPTQFGPNEDFARYPRTPKEDLAMLETAGVQAVLMPDEAMIYPFGLEEAIGFTLPARYTDILCGADRPGHFQGVAAVVTRLFNLVAPDIAVFGNKDFQQLWLIRRLVADLHLPIAIEGVDIHRDGDGLAMSSRNRYLNSEERAAAPLIYQTLVASRDAMQQGKAIADVLREARERLEQGGFAVQYLELRHQDDLQPAEDLSRPVVLLVAAKIGNTRLIDNIVF
ncbi:MAG: pantoate--beta-alanine ligase [Cardiobacteriaceae bacterium]|nr:pantoate--beta-alanine ligase [Cardiobacteriaceae bacterium]